MTNSSNYLAAVIAAGVWVASGCGGSAPAAGDPAKPGQDPTAVTADPVAPPTSLGVAKDATVLAEDGSHVQLASTWMNSNAVIVFLRGHW